MSQSWIKTRRNAPGGGSVSLVEEKILEIEKRVMEIEKRTRGLNERKPGKGNGKKEGPEKTTSIGEMSLRELELLWESQHTGVLSVLEESLKEIPMDEEDGFLLGSVIKTLQCDRECLETGLEEIREIKKGQFHRLQLKHLETEGTPEEIALSSDERVPEDEVLQTVTVSLAEVKRS